ncbi:MAG TPA: hypothetical protein VMF06_25290 [Candidatus Limnocylindria bacterium]|nr:hypothetical protein [Candidatus Limnocylindria bacterium]
MNLRSTPVAIALFNAETGESQIIASLRDTVGSQISSNSVIFPSAFSESGVEADIVYRVSISSFEQDVILRKPIDVSSFGFPTNATRIQILTEFYDAPNPDKTRRPIRIESSEKVRAKMAEPDLIDEVLDFGQFALTTGRAFPTGQNLAQGNSDTPVVKQFQRVANRTFLVESLEFQNVQTSLDKLPAGEGGSHIQNKKAKVRNFNGLVDQIRSRSPSDTVHPTLAQVSDSAQLARLLANPGYVIDYAGTIGSTTSTTLFPGDKTHVVVSPVVCNGAVVIEGGAIFKFPSSTTHAAGDPTPINTSIQINGTLTCKSTAFRPIIFTAIDDDNIGDSAANVGGLPYTGDVTSVDGYPRYYANPALLFSYTTSSVANLRFCYCQESIRTSGSVGTVVADSQFVACLRGVTISGSGTISGGSGPNITVNNALFAKVVYPVTLGWSGTGAGARLAHCTTDAATTLVTGTASTASCTFTNSIIVGSPAFSTGPVQLSGDYNGFYGNGTGTATFGSHPQADTTWPFEALEPANFDDSTYIAWPCVYFGNYYLRVESPFSDSGTSALASSLLASIRARTTRPPDFLAKNIVADLELSPAVDRDTAVPDLGYHYTPIDYFCTMTTVNNATLRIMPGVVLAFATPWLAENNIYPEWGIRVNTGGRLVVEGLPTNHVVFARLNAIQESPWAAWDWVGPIISTKGMQRDLVPATPLPEVSLRYADFPAVAGPAVHFGQLASHAFDLIGNVTLDGCLFQGGYFASNAGGPSFRIVEIRNTVFDRTAIDILPINVTVPNPVPEQLSIYNSLFYNCSLRLRPLPAANWLVTDNIFDTCTLDSQNGAIANNHHNAYVAMTSRLQPAAPTTTDPNLTSLTYASGPLGQFYLPSTATQLINKGSRYAKYAGLYHFTSLTSNVKEGNETPVASEDPKTVNIGQHYLALSAGKPVDSDGDKIADYIEDVNGDGANPSPANESPWESANSGLPAIISPSTGTTCSGITKVRFRLGGNIANVASVTLFVDGFPTDAALSRRQPSENGGELELDTQKLSQGPHTLNIASHYTDSTTSLRDSEYSDPISITSNNSMSYPNWQQISDAQARVSLQTTLPTTYYRIDWYSSKSPIESNPTVVHSNVGSSANGVEFSSDVASLQYGPANESPYLFPMVQIGSSATQLGPQTAKPSIPRDPPFDSDGAWVVSYSDDDTDFTDASNILDPLHAVNGVQERWMHESCLDGWLHAPWTANLPVLWTAGMMNSDRKGPQTYPIRNMPGKNTGHAGEDQRLLLSYLADSTTRNFYGSGHGLPDEFINIYKSIYEAKLGRKRFRFAFLDGCLTYSRDLLNCFGMENGEFSQEITDLNYYKFINPSTGASERRIRPGAFVSWSTSIPQCYFLPTEQTDPTTHLVCNWKHYTAAANIRIQLLEVWSVQGKSLKEAVSFANGVAYLSFEPNESPIHNSNGKTIQTGGGLALELYNPTVHLKICGFAPLKYDQFNHPADTW